MPGIKCLDSLTWTRVVAGSCYWSYYFVFCRISAFIRRSDAFNVCMLLNTHQLEPYQGHGYHLPHDIKEKPSGLGAFPAVFSFPGVSLVLLQMRSTILRPRTRIKNTRLFYYCIMIHVGY